MAATNLYLLLDLQNYAGGIGDNMNAYCYLQTAGAGDWNDLNLAWITTVLPAVLAIQSAAVQHMSLETTNLNDPADFGTAGYAGAQVGGRGGDGISAFVNWAFQYTRTTRAVRNGAKRIMGVAEPDQANGVAVGGIVALLNAAAVAFNTTLTDLSGNAWSPRILRRANLAHVPPVLQASFPISGVQYTRISTQNTRKR